MTVYARDGCVVASQQLGTLVCGFVDRWQRERPVVARNQKTNSEPTMSPLEWLAQEAQVPEETVKKLAARDRSGQPAPRWSRTVELRLADAIVSAIGAPEAFQDGTLEVMPNKNATRAARAACCGSLNGSLT